MTRPAFAQTLLLSLLVATPATLWAQNALSELDANDDGAIGRQEALAAQVEAFHRLDGDGNGQIDREELAASQPAPESDRPPREVLRARRKARERWFTNLDGDDSGGVSLTEYQGAMTPYFDRLDSDGNGVLDGAELKRAIGEPE
jgi:hypothetical protein